MSNGPLDLTAKVSDHRKTKIVSRATSSNRASLIGRECTRQIVYERTRWQEKKLHDEGLQAIFDGGNYLEEMALKDLKESGVKIVQQQRDLALPAYEITGHIDAAVDDDGKLYPIDIKSMSPHIFPTINDPSDFFNHKYDHVRGYPAQILLYTHMMAADYGILYCVNKTTFQTKDIWFKMADYMDVIESLKEKALEVTKHVRAGSLPDRIEDTTLCERCAFAHICLPDKDFGPAVTIIDDPEFRAMLDRWEQTKADGKEHQELDEEIKSRIKKAYLELPGPAGITAAGSQTRPGGEHAPESRRRTSWEFSVGPFSITAKEQTRKEWFVDENLTKMVGEIKEKKVKVIKIERREL